jgi:iron complex outermembrane receptor protein
MNNKTLAKVFFASVLSCAMRMNAQHSISGQVRTAQGEPVPFAVIGIKNTQWSTIAGADGSFKIRNLKNDVYILTTRGVGFLEKTDTLSLSGDLSFDPVLQESNKHLDEVVVNATRVDQNSGMAYNNVDAETLKKQNLGQDAPYMLNQLPGVVVNSDAGNGVGYTGLRIRGSDATRINVTINGVPVNDAESQGTFWVNMPDLVSSVNNIQVQRGVGASSNGAGAFGASINFQTNQLNEKPYAEVISTAGSFATFRNTLAAGTGLMNGKFTLDARASSVKSAGYIDRASSDLQSYYLAAGYYGKKTVLKFINFSGWEKTYQAWNYVPEDSIRNGNRTYNSCGEYYDANGNLRYYRNETDNYNQNNYQLHLIQQVNSRLNFNLTAHYTKGKGYYEQYRAGERFSRYNMAAPVFHINDSVSYTVQSTDLIRRRWLNNDFVGGIFNLNYTPSSRLSFVLGGGYNTYFGLHYGRVMWATYASDAEIDHQYYLNTANKNDGNVYLKANYRPTSDLNVFFDMQVRAVDYRFLGFNDTIAGDAEMTMQNQAYVFFNPKMGISYNLNRNTNVYASVAVGNKEPNRNDFVESTPSSRPKPEQLLDIEAGFKYSLRKLYLSANVYNMQYRNQLVLNGQINDVGAYTRINVPNSYRRGIEIEANYNFSRLVSLGGNIALSRNKIKEFVEFTDSSDAAYSVYTQYKKEYRNTDISFSPDLVSSVVLTLRPVKGLEIALINKYVGRQFLDNTSDVKRSINPYNVVDLRINYTVKTRLIPEIGLMLGVYNLLNAAYETNGYTYSYYTDATLHTFNFLAPAAPVNFLGGVSLKF